jgi:class 3 adenylate cyclase
MERRSAARRQRELSVALRRAAAPREPAVLKVVGDGCLAGFEDPVIALAFLGDMQAALAETDLESIKASK